MVGGQLNLGFAPRWDVFDEVYAGKYPTRFGQHTVFHVKAHGGELARLYAMGGLSSICSFLACSRTNGEIHTGSRSSGCGASAK